MAYTDSVIGYGVGTLTDPAPVSTNDSLIGFSVGALSNPSSAEDSVIGFVTNRLRDPHRPIGIFTGVGVVRYTARLVFDGTTWR